MTRSIFRIWGLWQHSLNFLFCLTEFLLFFFGLLLTYLFRVFTNKAKWLSVLFFFFHFFSSLCQYYFRLGDSYRSLYSRLLFWLQNRVDGSLISCLRYSLLIHWGIHQSWATCLCWRSKTLYWLLHLLRIFSHFIQSGFKLFFSICQSLLFLVDLILFSLSFFGFFFLFFFSLFFFFLSLLSSYLGLELWILEMLFNEFVFVLGHFCYWTKSFKVISLLFRFFNFLLDLSFLLAFWFFLCKWNFRLNIFSCSKDFDWYWH